VQLRILEFAYRARDLVRLLIQHDAASLGSAVGRFENVGLIFVNRMEESDSGTYRVF
jgi:hypothetical protein